jgi:hypothetical protein
MIVYPEGTKVYITIHDTFWRNQHFHNSDFLISNLPAEDLPEAFALHLADPAKFVRPVPRGVNADIKTFEIFA